jgi:biotin transport system substrate-specific component
MQIGSTVHQTRYDIFHWRYHTSLPWKIATALGMAGLTGILAQIRVPLPWSPIPLTGQTLAVLLVGVTLGGRWGSISMAIYGILGIAGIPWLNAASSGLGATAGYILGFALAAFFIGHLTDKYMPARRFESLFGTMLVANFILIYVPGVTWLWAWLNLIIKQPASLFYAINMGVLPFIAGDILKAAIAAGVAWAIMPKSSFSNNPKTFDANTES